MMQYSYSRYRPDVARFAIEEISADSISEFFEDFTTEGKDHSAGDKETADYIAEQWRQFGIDK